MLAWRGLRRGGLRNRERQPGIPARGTVDGVELAIGPQAQKAFQVSHRENISDLRTGTEHACSEPAQNRALAAVIGNLLKGITGHADEKLLREEVRGAPVEMEIDAALVLGVRILEIIGQAGDAGKFIPGRRIEIGVAAAGVDRAMTNAILANC